MRGWPLAAVCIVASAAACAGARSSSPVCMAGSSMDGGRCRSWEAPRHHLPFREGHRTKIMQGFHGYLSHKEDLAYSVDFRCEDGTPVTASRDGIVWKLREDSNKGCADASCIDEANFVIIDNGDGTYAEYYHLRHLGVLVDEGQPVCAGDVIALCGNTGFSTGPHLHFSVTDTSRRTIPFQFQEERHRRLGFGFPIPDADVVSQNKPKRKCKPKSSSLGRDAFAHQGIVLEDRMELVVAKRGPTRIRGRYFGDHPKVALHRRQRDAGSWLTQCADVQPNGRFEIGYSWPNENWGAGHYLLILTGATKDCGSPGWHWSYDVLLK